MTEPEAVVRRKRLDEAELARRVSEGSDTALARLITIIENDPIKMERVLPVIQPHRGKALCIGFTGPPGAGKSSLVNQVTKILRSQGKKVGIIAIDPSSPFTGGAFLGDRIRMQEHNTDSGVFIRSLATRGSLGGLSQSTKDVIALMDVFGCDYILVETVGVGQTELDIMQTTDLTVVVLVPEGGDSVQAMKAGLMEIGDIFVINKSDRPGADSLNIQLQSVLQMNPRNHGISKPVVLTQGIQGTGISELVQTIAEFVEHLSGSELARRREERRKLELEGLLMRHVLREWKTLTGGHDGALKVLGDVVSGERDPYSALKQLFPEGCLKGTAVG